MSVFGAPARTAAWLGWQVESNWADVFTFVVYSALRPIGTALILAGMYWAVAGRVAGPELFAAFYLGNAFHEYVVRVVVGMGWVIVEEREEYETLKFVYASPIGMLTYLWGRASIKLVLATVSVVLVLVVGWFLGVRWDWTQVHWGWLALAFPLGLVATVFLSFLVAGWALLLPRIAISMNEGLAVLLYLMSGVIYPVDLLPAGLRHLALALPFTYWYEALRRFLLGHGASHLLGGLSDAQLTGALALTTALVALVSWRGYALLEHRARMLGRLENSTLF